MTSIEPRSVRTKAPTLRAGNATSRTIPVGESAQVTPCPRAASFRFACPCTIPAHPYRYSRNRAVAAVPLVTSSIVSHECRVAYHCLRPTFAAECTMVPALSTLVVRRDINPVSIHQRPHNCHDMLIVNDLQNWDLLLASSGHPTQLLASTSNGLMCRVSPSLPLELREKAF